MSPFIKNYIVTLIVFLGIDFLWLTVIAKNFYQKHIGYLLGKPMLLPAFIFYLLFVLGLLVFVINPNIKEGVTWKLVLSAALFGMVTYATYDLTNLATIKNWPLLVTVVDIIWGMLLATTTSVISILIIKKIF